MYDFIKNFFKYDIAKVPNDNVSDLVQKIYAVCERLAEANELPYETPFYVLKVLTRCIVPDLIGPFEIMINAEHVRQIESDGGVVNDKITLERSKNITLMANNSFQSLIFPIPRELPASIRSYWGLATIVMQKIISRKSALSLKIKRRSSE